MPRDSSGNYTLSPTGNPVVTATVISSTWANATLADLAVAMTDSLDRSGLGGMLASLRLIAGVIGAPGLSWNTETNSGLYRAGAGDFRYSIAATDILQIVTAAFRTVDGSLGVPSFSFISDPDTGIYRFGANQISIVAGGVEAARGLNNQLYVPLPLITSDGAVGAPAWAFNFDPDTGVYRGGSGNVRVSGNATLMFDMDATNLWVRSFFVHHFSDGAVGLPGLTFINDTNTGMYRVGADEIALTTGGVARFDVSTTALTSTLPLYLPNGTQAAPSHSFASDPDTGMYGNGANAILFTAGNSVVLSLGATSLNMNAGVSINAADGALGTPSVTFGNDPDTGLYRLGVNQMSLVGGGVESARAASTFFYVPLPFLVSDGTAPNPAITFNSDSDTGFFHDTANQIAISLGGVKFGSFAATEFLGPDGGVGVPAYGFLNDSDTGVGRNGANGAVLYAGGQAIVSWTWTGAVGLFSLPTIASAGSATGGAATALPALPIGYFTIGINGTDRKVPYYAV